MDLLTGFGVGACIWTGLHFLPSGNKTDRVILDTWFNMGVGIKSGKHLILPKKKRGAWFLPAGLSPKDIEKTLPALSYQLNCKVDMEVRGMGVYLHCRPMLPGLVPYVSQDLKKYRLGLVLGKTYDKDCFILDLKDESPYLLACGGVGMGKSNFLGLVMKQLQENYMDPSYLQYFLIDLKLGVELGKWADSPLCGGYCWDPTTDQLPAMLGYLTREIRRRMKIFKAAGVYKIDEYNLLPGADRLPYLLLIIDEYAEMGRDKAAEDKLQSLLAIARAAGLRVIVSTQRPTADLINSSIKALIPSRLCFSVADRVNSEVVLDQGGAEALGGIPGRGLLLSGARVREVQIMLAS